MNGADLAQQLRDIHEPQAIGLWPLAWGWWALMGLTLLLIALVIWRLHTTRQRRQLRKDALQLLDNLLQRHQQQPDDGWLLQQCNQLLKRLAIQRFSHAAVGPLHGDSWREFLVEHSKTDDANCPRLLAESPYQPRVTIPDSDALARWMRQWIRSCP